MRIANKMTALQQEGNDMESNDIWLRRTLNSGISRRTVLQGLGTAGLAAGLSLPLARRAAAADPVTLRWWSPQASPDQLEDVPDPDRHIRGRQSRASRSSSNRPRTRAIRPSSRRPSPPSSCPTSSRTCRPSPRRTITAKDCSSRWTTSSRRSAKTSIFPAPTTSTRPPTATIAARPSATRPPTCSGCART